MLITIILNREKKYRHLTKILPLR